MKYTKFLSFLLFCFSITTYSQLSKLVLPVNSSIYIDRVAFSPNGRFLVSSSNDFTLKQSKFTLWDATSHNFLFTISGKENLQDCFAFSSDSKFLLLFGDPIKSYGNGIVSCIDIYNQKLLWEQEGKYIGTDKNGNVAIAENTEESKEIISIFQISTGGNISVDRARNWDLKLAKLSNSGRFSAQLRSNNLTPNYDSKRSALFADTLDIFDHIKNQLLPVTLYSQKGFTDIKFSPKDDLLVCIGGDSMMNIVDLSDPKIAQVQNIGFIANDVQIHSNGQYVSLVEAIEHSGKRSNGNMFTLWHLPSGTCMDTLHLDATVEEIRFNPILKQIAIKTEDIKLYDFDNKVFHNLKGLNREDFLTSFAFDSTGNVLALAYDNGNITLHDYKDSTIELLKYFKSPVNQVAFANNNLFISWNDHNHTSSGDDWIERMYPYPYVNIVKQWSIDSGLVNTRPFRGGISSHTIRVSQNNQLNILYDSMNTFSLWKTSTGKKLRTLKRNEELDYFGFKFSGDNRYLASTSLPKERSLKDYKCHVWNLLNANQTTIELTQSASIIGISNKGTYMMLYYEDGVVPGTDSIGSFFELWHIPTKTMRRRLHNIEVETDNYLYKYDRSFFLPQNDCYLAKVRGSNTFSFFDISDSTPRFTLHHTSVADTVWQSDLLVSPSGNYLLTTSNSIYFLWNSANGQFIDSFKLNFTPEKFQFSRDETRVYFIGTGTSILNFAVWKTQTGEKMTKVILNEATFPEFNDKINSLSINESNSFAIISSTTSHITLINLHSLEIMYTIVPLGLEHYIAFDQKGNYNIPEWLDHLNFVCPSGLSYIKKDIMSKRINKMIPILMKKTKNASLTTQSVLPCQ